MTPIPKSMRQLTINVRDAHLLITHGYFQANVVARRFFGDRANRPAIRTVMKPMTRDRVPEVASARWCIGHAQLTGIG